MGGMRGRGKREGEKKKGGREGGEGKGEEGKSIPVLETPEDIVKGRYNNYRQLFFFLLS